MGRRKIPEKLQNWIEARKRFRLSHAHVQMARELGLNPKKLGGMANHRQERWKVPLPDYIEHLYEKSFGKSRPDRVFSIEEVFEHDQQRRAERAERKRQKRLEVESEQTAPPPAQAEAGSEAPT
jgi:hypothetical protein